MTPALLGGMALIALPVLLHLVMRRQPRKIAFPALQFVRKRQQANRRRMNLRHWLLLALRCLLVAGLAGALARPTLKGSGLRGKEGAPLAVALVVDNSLRMQYVHENKTRQQQATETAGWLVGRLPDDAEVAVVDRSRSTGGFVVDIGTAEARLKNLAPETSPRPWEDAVREAVELVADRPDHRQEVFLFSDMSAAEWSETTLESINESLAEAPDVRIYLVDVGVEQHRNMSLGQLELRSNTLRPGQPLHLDVPVNAIGLTEAPLVELYLKASPRNAVKRGQRIVELNDEGAGKATFELGDLPLGVHQGYVRLAAGDPLEVDNTRYFTVEVRPPARVLLLGQQQSDTLFLREALSPALIANRTAVRFECETQRFSQAASLELENYAAVGLLDPPPLSEEFWQVLVDYAYGGGGVGIFLGHRARLSGFNESTVQQMLPGKLKLRSRYATYLRPRSLAHPALSGLRDYAENIPWEVYPVWKYWEFSELAADAYVVARFSNNQPALLERPVGRGRVLTLATPVSDRLEPMGREPWNLLPTGPEPWPFVALANQMMGYLAQNENESLAFFAGETVNLRLAPKDRISSYILHQPGEEPLRRSLPPGEDTVRIGTTRFLGNYQVASGGTTRQLQLGFSINAST
ncbi:MAG: BatA domain-containing protein, partial [Pirellulales bacterium]|nr:BatA domain-containing protein [Pirellulales bacterium]